MALSDDIGMLEALVQRMVEESGRPADFDARAWLTWWLAAPVPALGNRRPLDVLNEPGGMEQVQGILSRTQSGTYS